MLIIASIISITGGVVFYLSIQEIVTKLSPFPLEDPSAIQSLEQYITGFATVLIMILVIAIVVGIIQLVAIFAKVIPGVSKLSKAEPEYSTASTLIKVGYVVGIALFIVGFLVIVLAIVATISAPSLPMLLLGVFGGIVLILVGGLFLLIGRVGFIMLGFKLGEKETQSDYTVVAVLYIIGLLINFLGFVLPPAGILSDVIYLVAFILLYSALSKTIEKRKRTPPSPPLYHHVGLPPI